MKMRMPRSSPFHGIENYLSVSINMSRLHTNERQNRRAWVTCRGVGVVCFGGTVLRERGQRERGPEILREGLIEHSAKTHALEHQQQTPFRSHAGALQFPSQRGLVLTLRGLAELAYAQACGA